MKPNLFFGEPSEQPVKEKPDQEAIHFQWSVKIPVRDGVQLNATVYRPKDPTPVPAIFTLTPYIGDSYHPRAAYFAKNGYAFALVDCRGRGNSGGEFEPFVNEGRDAHDVVLWLAGQPWCSGSVTMWGGSYGGFDQWMALKEFPAPLKTIVPAASAHAGIDFPFYKNIFYPYEIQWLTFTSGVTGNAALFGDREFWIEKFRQWYLSGRPFKELDEITGNLSTHFQTFVEHPTPDAYWDRMLISPEEYARIDLPILSITGHYDGDQPGALHYYRQHMQHGSQAAIERHFLVIGPWDHAGTRTPNREFGGLKFGQAAIVDLNKLHKEWYDWTMKDGPKPEFLKDRVAYYMMGAEEWRYAPSLEAISNETRRLFLDSSLGQANDVFHSGLLGETPPRDSQPDRYVYDPLDVRPEELERKDIENYLTDQRHTMQLFGSGLVYHSEPLEQDTEISGVVNLVAWMSLDVPDTDFRAELSEILLDGSHILLADDMLRARYRDSLRAEKLVVPGEINCYHFDGFMYFSRRIARGSRLRLVLRASNSIYSQKNFNGGGVVSSESAADARTAHVTLYHDAQHLSFLELPLVNKVPGT